jgi:hypothetical protein
MHRDDNASLWSARRSRRPQARLETSYTRTGRPRRHLLSQLASRSAGEGSGHTARVHVCEESHHGIVPMNHSNKDGTSSSTRTRHRAGLRVSHGWASVRTSHKLGRSSSARRTGCAKERPSGSVRGAPGNRCPYRDRQLNLSERQVLRICIADSSPLRILSSLLSLLEQQPQLGHPS